MIGNKIPLPNGRLLRGKNFFLSLNSESSSVLMDQRHSYRTDPEETIQVGIHGIDKRCNAKVRYFV